MATIERQRRRRRCRRKSAPEGARSVLACRSAGTGRRQKYERAESGDEGRVIGRGPCRARVRFQIVSLRDGCPRSHRRRRGESYRGATSGLTHRCRDSVGLRRVTTRRAGARRAVRANEGTWGRRSRLARYDPMAVRPSLDRGVRTRPGRQDSMRHDPPPLLRRDDGPRPRGDRPPWSTTSGVERTPPTSGASRPRSRWAPDAVLRVSEKHSFERYRSSLGQTKVMVAHKDAGGWSQLGDGAAPWDGGRLRAAPETRG